MTIFTFQKLPLIPLALHLLCTPLTSLEPEIYKTQHLLKQAEELYQSEMFEEAIPLFSFVLSQLSPTDLHKQTNLTLRVAEVYLLMGQAKQAIEELNNLSATPLIHNKNRTKINALRMLALIQLDRVQEAVTTLSEETPDRDLLLGYAYTFTNEQEKAKIHLSTYLNKHPHHILATLLLAKEKVKSHSTKLALNDLVTLEKKTNSDHPLYGELLNTLGTLYLQQSQLENALITLQKAKNLPNAPFQSWYQSTILNLSHCYLGKCYLETTPKKEKLSNLSVIEKLLRSEMRRTPSEEYTLSLAKLLLTKGTLFNDQEAFNTCRALIADPSTFSKHKTQIEALLIKAESEPNYSSREKILKRFANLSITSAPPSLIATGWLIRGNSERKEGFANYPTYKFRSHLEHAISYYKKAFATFPHPTSKEALETLKLWGQTANDLQSQRHLEENYQVLSNLLEKNPSQAELFYLKALLAMHLYHNTWKEEYLYNASETLQTGLAKLKKNIQTPSMRLLLGKALFLQKQYKETEKTLIAIEKESPSTSIASEALYWCGRAAANQTSPLHSKASYYQRCYTLYPNSSFAPEAFFRIYSYQEYLQGGKEAKKHLGEMRKKFPSHHYTLDTLFLLALDNKRDRKSAKGKWISTQDLTAAIDLFQDLESLQSQLKEEGLIPQDLEKHYQNLALRSNLERALCNLAIGRSAKGTKRKIHLEYAEKVLLQLTDLLKNLETNSLIEEIKEESRYGLAKTYLESENFIEAEAYLHQIIDYYKKAKVTKGYYLSRAWYDLATIAIQSENYPQAVSYLNLAKESARGRVLSTNQTVDLWLQMGLCHKEMKDYDQAMLYLTKAINEDAVSGLRIKAMYVRAEIYELQGRFELARKQLEATSHKGGEWAKKAKEILKDKYGYH